MHGNEPDVRCMGDIVFDDDIGMSSVRYGYYAGTDHAGAYDTFVCSERQKLGKHKKSSDMLPAECYLCGGICDHTLEERVES